MITTRESINYQFSIMFGYSSPNQENLIVGDIIGPGSLKKAIIKELSVDVIKYLTQFNAMLRDYTGSELFFIEFELKNFYPEDFKTRIFPKSMILVPGNYKDCESLMLALKPEIGYINIHKSNKAITHISRLFFEVEDYANNPELSNNQKEHVFRRFASRFTKKLYGQLIENKWNKEMIGLSDLMPTEKKFLEKYCKLKSRIDLQWHKNPTEITLSHNKFEKLKNPFEGKTAKEHLKFSITEPSANFVIEKTLNLGTNLLNLVNTGTIDYFQNKLVKFFIKNIEKDLAKVNELKSENWLISRIDIILEQIKTNIERFFSLSKDFQISGEKGSIDQILELFGKKIKNNNNNDFSELFNITSNFISQMIIKKDEIRANELTSVFNYFSELVNNTLMIINTYKYQYLVNRNLRLNIKNLIKELKEEFINEPKPSRILGERIFDEFHEHILKKIEIISFSNKNDREFDNKILLKSFKTLVFNNLDEFFRKIELKIKDIVSFTEINLQDSINIKDSIKGFKMFSDELHFLLSYILRYSTINRYLKEVPSSEISDPVLFSTKFHRFLEKRLSGIDLTWKNYILEWIKDYTKIFLKLNVKKEWTLIEIYNDFINYLEERESKSQDPEKFMEFLDNFIAQEKNEDKRDNLLSFLKQYEYFLGIKTEFPIYIKKKIENKISSLLATSQEIIPLEYFKVNESDNFYNYIRKNELKYFSKLIPIPKSLILKYNSTNEERELFKGDLFQVFNIKYWGDGYIMVNLLDNFKQVYREWIKEL
ncbi:MAG: hypothetical protein KGD63_03230 [Candidatus Lokiarchaeota archaeon]|nr:hypothetical protein [Candidatus Lokiarchaeota archaeon]